MRAPRTLVDGAPGTVVEIGVRPEKFRLRESSDPVPAGHNALSGVVRDASYLGVSTQYEVVTADGDLHLPRASKTEIAAAILDAVLSRRSSPAIKVPR